VSNLNPIQAASPSRGQCLVICHKQLGDVTLLEPALAKLVAHYGSVDLLTRSALRPLASLIPGVQSASRPWLKSYRAVFAYDDLDKTAMHALPVFARRKDLLLRTKTEASWLNRLVFSSVRIPGLGDEYLAHYNWKHTLVDGDQPFRAPRLQMPPDHWKPSGFALDEFLLLNPTAGWKSKRWKTKSWLEVVEGLLQVEPNLRVLITSGEQDWQIEHSRQIAAGLGCRVEFLGGKTRLEEFLWLLSRTRMVLGVDGAASHLAAAFGRKNLTLFFKTNAKNWHFPTNRNVAILASTDASTNKLSIETEEVVRHSISLWKAPES
jgi:ADP-heptose:LPS heptosyltransferase